MAVTNFSDPVFAATTGLDPQMLQGIINACETASKDMTGVNARVGDAAEAIFSAMESRAGAALRTRLQTWYDDFQMVKSSFDDLNRRATDMKNALIYADEHGTEAANAGQG